MATKYVTLKDSNGDTLYPQAVATNLAPGSIDTTELADGAVTGAKIDWTTITPTSITPSDYISFSSGITINEVMGYKIGKLVNIHYDIATTLSAGQNIVGTCTNKILKATYGAGRVTNPGQGVASIVVIPSGDLRIYTSQYGTASAGDVWFFEA